MSEHRYTNGATRDQQKAANHRYQTKQRQQRQWLDLISQESGIPKEALVTQRNAEIIAEILRRESHPAAA